MYQPAGHSPPFWTAVDDTWKTKEFGLFLGRYNQSLDSINAAPLNDGGQLTLGGVDPDIYVGDIDYIPLVHVETGSSSPLSGNSGAINESAAQVYWSIPMDGLEAFGAEISLGPFDMNKIAIFDSGTTAIYGPPAAVDAFYGQLPSAKYAGSGVYAFKCSEVANANVSFTFGGVPYPVQASDLILEFASKDNHCFGTIMRFDSREASWLFGAAFLANLYTSYRIDPPAVGLAKLSPEYDWKYTGKLNSARTISTSLTTIFTGLLLSVYLAFI
jgi:hypothetical protein